MLVSRGAIVLLTATLTGMGAVAECEVLARRLGMAPSPSYSECAVIGAPDHLPDGDYTIEFEGIRATATKLRGLWLAFDPPEDDVEDSVSLIRD